MYRIAVQKSTGRIVDAQSGRSDDLETLRANALAGGVPADDIEVMAVTDREYSDRIAAQRDGERTYADRRRAEYPSLEEQVAALMDGGKALADVKAAIAAVKAKYPKPQ